MIARFKRFPPLLKTLLLIAFLSLAVMAVSLLLFPEWRTTPAWLLMLFLAAVLGVTAFLDNLSGAHSLVNEKPTDTPPETEVTVQILLQQTTTAILQQLDQRHLSVSPAELEQAAKSYLTYLVDRYQILDFKGMGVDRVIALPLLEMYVPLRARIELPKGETWDRAVTVGGAHLPDEEMQRLSEPQPVLELLQKHDGLIILGDPGAGKTTFLKYLAVRLALGQRDDLAIGNRLPILLPLSAYAKALDEQDVSLNEFISRYYNEQGIELPLAPLFEETLKQGQALFLLDGLDEVQSLKQRGLVVDRFITYFAFHHQAGNKFVLTSRIIGYDEVRPANKYLKECTLVDFDRGEIESFIDKWTSALEKAARGGRTAFGSTEAQRERRELLAAIDRNAGVRRLATNPLFLTILALMKRQGVTLPERRVELYDKYIETLIRHWNLARGLDRRTARELDYGTTVHMLAALALWMHENNPGISLAPREEVKRRLTAIYRRRGVSDPERNTQQLIRDAREYAGLLVERGQRVYGFIHLTFQEYLAAIGITQQEDESLEPVVDLLASHVGDDNWHEVTLLAIAYVGIIQQREKPASRILRQLIDRSPGEPGEAVILAGQAVADMSPGGITLQFLEEIAAELVRTMQSNDVSVQRRAQAGHVLGQMTYADGTPLDTRPGVGYTLRSGQKIPDIVWGGIVPVGMYTIGGDKQASSIFERKVQVEWPYQLARYPVTYVQFQCFMDADDFDDARWWEGIPENAKVINEARFPVVNHPRDTVSWYQAVAFCRWLYDKLKQELPDGAVIDLPHENEWEVAARYPDNRFYPWGNDFDPKKANTTEGGISGSTAVGIYPTGKNPALGLYDLSGNVWEWCRNKPNDLDEPWVDRDPVDDGVARRVVRGGSWFYYRSFARAAYRVNPRPGNRDLDYGFRVVVRRPPSHSVH